MWDGSPSTANAGCSHQHCVRCHVDYCSQHSVYHQIFFRGSSCSTPEKAVHDHVMVETPRLATPLIWTCCTLPYATILLAIHAHARPTTTFLILILFCVFVRQFAWPDATSGPGLSSLLCSTPGLFLTRVGSASLSSNTILHVLAFAVVSYLHLGVDSAHFQPHCQDSHSPCYNDLLQL